jgi:hypothetical protein
MKKITLLALLFAFSLLVLPAKSQPLPIPITIKVTAAYQLGIPVSVLNTRTGESMITNTNEYGEVTLDWFNSQLGIKEGDLFRITVNEDKVVERRYDGNPLDIIEVSLIPDGCPVCQTCQEPEQCEQCETCESCDECEPCPADLLSLLIGAGIAGAVAVGGFLAKRKLSPAEMQSLEDTLAREMKVGSGFRAYKHTDGRVRYKHLHYGITGYHDPMTVHKNPQYRHEAGELIV